MCVSRLSGCVINKCLYMKRCYMNSMYSMSTYLPNLLLVPNPVSCSSWSPKVCKCPSLKAFIFPKPALRRAQGFKVFPIKYDFLKDTCFYIDDVWSCFPLLFYGHISYAYMALSENREVPLNHSKNRKIHWFIIMFPASNCRNLGTLRLGYDWFVKSWSINYICTNIIVEPPMQQ